MFGGMSLYSAKKNRYERKGEGGRKIKTERGKQRKKTKKKQQQQQTQEQKKKEINESERDVGIICTWKST